MKKITGQRNFGITFYIFQNIKLYSLLNMKNSFINMEGLKSKKKEIIIN